jgi:hypothetical protein
MTAIPAIAAATLGKARLANGVLAIAAAPLLNSFRLRMFLSANRRPLRRNMC